MKIIFNDATELQVQKVEQKGDYLRVLTVSATPEQLRRIFEDIVKTATMVVEERGQKGEPLVGYTTFYRTEEYPGKIYGIVQYRPERTPEAQTEVQEAAIIMAKIQAESLPEEQALQVKALYDSWSGDGVAYKTGKYLTYKDILYKVCLLYTSRCV